jgi:galactose oxidase
VLVRIMAPCAATAAVLLATVGTGHHVPGAHAGHAAHLLPVPAAAYLPAAHVLPRTGWTASASDIHSGDPAAVALDGDNATFWRSSSAATLHTITIDLHTVTPVSALHYLPRQDGSQDGTICRFRVQLSTDGERWASAASGTWAADAVEKAAAFVTTSVRYVRLTALSAAGGAASTAAEVNLLGAAEQDPEPTLILNRTGWTAQASDEEATADGSLAPANVLDNDPYTMWHSAYSGTPVPLPHWITLDMKRARSISGLSYLPREGGGNGTIGDYQVALSADGSTWSAPVAEGTWADDPSLKTAYFAQTSARYVRLTALTEAGGRGPWSSASEINLLAPLDPAQAGRWGPVITFPIVPVSAVLLPHDKLLTFSAYQPDAFTGSGAGYTQTAILDLDTGVVSQREISNTGHEMFCTGLALLPDGRVLVNGGSDSGKTSIYDPATDTWTAGPLMNIPRGYQSDVTLSNGQVFTLGGSWSGGRGGKNGEVYTPDGTWRLLPNVTADSMLTADPAGIFRSDNHGWFFATAGANVFQAGPSRHMHWYGTTGDGSVRAAGVRGTSADAMNGDAAMYDVGKILTLGGSPAYDGQDATNRAYAIDISQGPSTRPTVTRLPDMAYRRSFANSVVLPNGQVVVVGGQVHAAPFVDRTAVLQAELWTPATGAFTKLASMAVPRTYHSVALLLPDGRVFSGGGGLCGSCQTNHPDGQIFTPPYLLNSDGSERARPELTAAPDASHRNATITVQASTTTTSFALVRAGAVTHTVDTDQRRIPLTPVSAKDGQFKLKLPADGGTLVPGNYLLFGLDAQGTPSVARMLTIS